MPGFEVSVDDKMDMAKYKCQISRSYTKYGEPDFPYFEEKWAFNMSQGYPYELRFELGRNNVVTNTLFVFENEEAKQRFLDENPSILKQLNI